MKKLKIVLATGGYDPIHSGHIEYFKAARRLGDKLIVGVNSDAWLTRKKNRPFMSVADRVKIVEELKCVDSVIEFDDSDGTACDAIRKVKSMYPNDEIIFVNGGDRTKDNIPEMSEPGVVFEFGVGGSDKINSSSWILEEWRYPKTERVWGKYTVLHEQGKEVKLKELTVDPGKSLSMQRHQQRAEHWFVADGVATVYTVNRSTDTELLGVFNKFESLHISRTEWHQLVNESREPLKIIEIQYGVDCVEEDIERQINGSTVK